jgi:hypothetical protein
MLYDTYFAESSPTYDIVEVEMSFVYRSWKGNCKENENAYYFQFDLKRQL